METHWQEINNYVINRAKTLLSTTNSTFVLGAGVSKGAKIPDWKTLLTKLITNIDTVFSETDYEAIIKQLNYSDIRAARYIKSAFYQKDSADKTKDSADKIKDSADKIKDSADKIKDSADKIKDSADKIKDSADKIEDSAEKIKDSADKIKDSAEKIKDSTDKESPENKFVEKVREILYSNIDRESPLIKTICKIICDDSKRVQSVITYNYDDLIEEELKKRDLEYYSVFRKNRSNDYYKFPIYHVHGFVPQIGNASKIVLCEEDYHEIYSYAFHWSNIEQLHAFERNTCFFIGLSMNDPNLRRLLEESFKDSEQEQNHFVFLPRTPLFSSDVETSNRDKIDKDFSIREEVLHNLGLQIIWYEDGKFEQINSILKQIANVD